MEGVSKFSNNGPRNMLSHITILRGFRMAGLAVVVAVLCLLGSAPTSVADTPYTITDIAEEMLAAEAKFTDLRLDYVFTHRAWDEPNGPKVVVEGVYAEKKMAQRLRYHDRKISAVYPEKQQTILMEDTLSSFNGQTTVILHRHSEAEQLRPMKGYIFNDYKKEGFPSLYKDPHTKIWYYAGMLLGDFLEENRETFLIESESEILDGIPTVKLVGTFSDRKLGMKLWVSPDLNFLPLKRQVIRADGEMLSETALYDLVRLPNDMWYPKKVQSPADPSGIPRPSIIHTYNISKISIDPIPVEFFSPEFPPNTHVIDDVLKISYTTY